MGRPLRIEYEGAVYHITARGNEKRDVFLDESDYLKFFDTLRRCRERYGLRIYAYALMGNHYHLLVETPAANLTAFMHNLQSAYTGYFNRRHRRVGHLFQGRYGAILVEKDTYLLDLVRYIHLNPVRAGFVVRPESWKWSSHGEYIADGKRGGLVERNEVFNILGRDRARAKAAYREMIESGLSSPPPSPMSGLVTQLALGSERFVDGVRKIVKNGGVSSARGVPAIRYFKRWSAKEADAAIVLVASHYGVPKSVLFKPGRPGNPARDVAIAVFRRFSTWSLGEIGERFRISESGVCKAVKRVDEAAAGNKPFSKGVNELYSRFKA